MAHWRTGWISDFHLGTKGSKADALLAFLREHEFEKLYLVGDIIDVWALRRGRFWPQAHNDVLQKLLRKGRKGTKLIYVPGNHDEFVAGYLGAYGNVSIQRHAMHTTADGRRLLVFHGHELDPAVQNLGWLTYLGDWGYTLLLQSNGAVNRTRQLLGLSPWSLSAYVKGRVKNVVGFINRFEEAAIRRAQHYRVEGVVCGHLHTAAMRTIGGIAYYNTGDWLESCTALVEGFDGKVQLLCHTAVPGTISVRGEPVQAP
ncbi:MAG: UDP-2,3-diacylglucosamine diphosphatase [Verrucomicrobia bacterium]|nr:UDP-2,3-diacylglucosamine diphosphatase [Verrucomicrobiota bacterium]